VSINRSKQANFIEEALSAQEGRDTAFQHNCGRDFTAMSIPSLSTSIPASYSSGLFAASLASRGGDIKEERRYTQMSRNLLKVLLT